MAYAIHVHIHKPKLKYIVIFSSIYVLGLVSFLVATKTPFPSKTQHVDASITQSRLPATDLLSEFTQAGFNPVVLGEVHRPFFSVSGKLVTLGQDNFQVFEYPDIEMASSQVAAFMKDVGTPKGRWKNTILHLYRKNSTVVYYMGNKPAVLAVLEGIFK